MGRDISKKFRERPIRETSERYTFPLVALAHKVELMAPTPLRKRIEALVDGLATRLDILARDPTYPLDVLEAQMHLTDPPPRHDTSAERLADIDWDKSEARRDAGAYLALLHWRIYGAPAKAQDNGYRAPPSDLEQTFRTEAARRRVERGEPELSNEQRQWLQEARYKALRNALRRSGRDVEKLVVDVCVNCRLMPNANMPNLRRGLDAMISARLPGAKDAPSFVERPVLTVEVV